MFYFVHILAGALIAKYFPSLWPVIILSIIAHFFLDIIPHWDSLADRNLFKKYYKVSLNRNLLLVEAADVLLGIVLILALYLNFRSNLMLIGAFFSLLPDMIKIGYFTPLKNSKTIKRYINFHTNIQTEIDWKLGLLIQIALAIALSLAIFC